MIAVKVENPQDVQRKLQSIGGQFSTGKVKRVFRKASKPYRAAIRRAPTPRSSEGPRKFMGATYYPGNLRRSFKELKLRRMRSAKAILIGAHRAASVSRGDIFRGSAKVNGWYAHFPEQGIAGTKKYTPQRYQETTWARYKDVTARASLELFKDLIE